MAILKCKMCGGELQLIEDENICECEYCGSKQTVPTVDDEKKAKLYERANKLRFNCDFDKAAGVYENIVNEFPDDAEGYWGLILSNYGIEYVDDPATGKKVPTCHRSSFDSIMDDPDFEMVMENSEGVARALYRDEAKQIEEIRKNIIEVSGKEAPYDIFICYKETDSFGGRTLDSVLAQDVYDALTGRGYIVFFSRISLEDKLGTEYEPYIFAALNSAKVMLAFGTSYDNYNAVWVKNEWGRFLKLMAKDKEKYLIPCFKDIDAYDIPKEFAKFQAQDLGKVGAIQDLLRGIDKIFGKGKDLEQTTSGPGNSSNDVGLSVLNAQTQALLKRGYMAVEDEEYEKADEFFEKVLNNDAECGQAYWGKVLCTNKFRNNEELVKAIREKIEKEKIDFEIEKETIVINFVEIARNADSGIGLLNDFDEDELNSLFMDWNGEKSVQSAEKYFLSLAEFDVENLKEIVGDRDFNRAVQNADPQIVQMIDKICTDVQSFARKRAQEEKEIVDNFHKTNQQAELEMKDRLSKIADRYDKLKERVGKNREAAMAKAEQVWKEAVKKHETDYEYHVRMIKESYQNRCNQWEKDKEKYKEYPAIMSKRAEIEKQLSQFPNESDVLKEKKEIQNKINVLQKERDALSGVFLGKKIKRLEEDLNLLKAKLNPIIEIENKIQNIKKELLELRIPTNPGERPELKIPEKGEPPRLEEFILKAEASSGIIQKEFVRSSLKVLGADTTVFLGAYPTKANGEKELVEWIVLAKDGNKTLLLAKEGLDSIPYNNVVARKTWEESSLRKYMNSEMLDILFNEGEKAMIIRTPINSPEENADRSADDKEDYLFLLNVDEADKYFTSENERKCRATPYAIVKGASVNWEEGNSCWWLQSNESNMRAAVVNEAGVVDRNGVFVHFVGKVVRPACWVGLMEE